MSTNLFEETQPERWGTAQEVAPEWKGSAVIYGPAQTQGSKKGFVHPTKGYVIIVDDNEKALKSWRADLVNSMRTCRPKRALDVPVAVNILVYVSRPRGHFGSGKNAGVLKPSAPILPGSGKDVDKVARAVLDAGSDAAWWTNDARVVDLHIRRRFDDGEGGERTWVWAWTVTTGLEQQPEFIEKDPAEVEPESDIRF